MAFSIPISNFQSQTALRGRLYTGEVDIVAEYGA